MSLSKIISTFNWDAMLSYLVKGAASAFSILIAFYAPIGWLLLIAFMAWLADTFCAFRLNRRVKKLHRRASGKFESAKMKKSFGWFVLALLALTFAFLVDLHLLKNVDYTAVKYTLGAYIFMQSWSILESESSCNDNPWARMLQRIMIDKTERHFDIKLTELKEELDNEKH
jgi:hypothetical protein